MEPNLTDDFDEHMVDPTGAEDPPEVEIIDDTPEADRRPLAKEEIADPTPEELQSYSESVRKRIDTLTFARNDERRRREQIDRQREEAIRYAQNVAEENRLLKAKLETGTVEVVEHAEKLAEARLSAAKEKLHKALTEADAEKVIQAQEELTEAKFAALQSRRAKDTLSESRLPANIQSTQLAQAPAPVDHRLEAWKARNTWFGPDPEKTAFALGVHHKLVSSGVQPNSDEYYQAIDRRVAEVFSAPNKPKQTTSKSTVVAPTTRSQGGKTTVRLTKSQVAIAQRLGVPLEQYAAQMAKLEK